MNQHRRLRTAISTVAAILLSGLLATSSVAQDKEKRKPAPGAQADKGKPGNAPGNKGKGQPEGHKGQPAGDAAEKPDGKGDDQADPAGQADDPAAAEEHKKQAEQFRKQAEEFRKRAEELKAKGKDKAAEKQAAKAAEHEAKAAEHEAKAAEREARKGGAGAGGADDPRFERIKQKAKDRRERRAQRGKEMREQARTRAKAVLAGKPMDQAFKQELLRHARRMARLNRIMTVAAEASDAEALERATKLLAKETARHRRWTDNYAKERGGQNSGQNNGQKDSKGGQP